MLVFSPRRAHPAAQKNVGTATPLYSTPGGQCRAQEVLLKKARASRKRPRQRRPTN